MGVHTSMTETVETQGPVDDSAIAKHVDSAAAVPAGDAAVQPEYTATADAESGVQPTVEMELLHTPEPWHDADEASDEDSDDDASDDDDGGDDWQGRLGMHQQQQDGGDDNNEGIRNTLHRYVVQEGYEKFPVTTAWIALLFVSSLLCWWRPEWKSTLCLHWPSVFRGEIHRLLTTFICFGGEAFNRRALIEFLFLYSNIGPYEERLRWESVLTNSSLSFTL